MTSLDTNVSNYTLSELLSIVGITNEDIKELAMTPKMVNSIKSAFTSRRCVSIQAPRYAGQEGGVFTLEDTIISDKPELDSGIDQETMLKSVKSALKNMSEKRRAILLLRYGVIKEKDIETLGAVDDKKRR